MITIRRIDHVGLGVADLEDATQRWALQFGLTVRERGAERARLCCDDEPCAVELLAGAPPGFHHVAYELAADCPLEQARAHLSASGAPVNVEGGTLHTADADGNRIVLLPYREPASRRVPHARPAGVATRRASATARLTSTSSPLISGAGAVLHRGARHEAHRLAR